MNKVRKEEIINLRNEGKSYKEIKEILKCNLSVISYWCKQEKLDNPNSNRKPSTEEIEHFKKLYNTGLTVTEVSNLVKFNSHTVGKYIGEKRRKLKVKTPSESVVSWRKRVKEKLVSYKGGCCENCGYNKCVNALQFHHLNPLEKDFTISGKSWGFEKLKLEVDKCKLLCANCHIEEHAK